MDKLIINAAITGMVPMKSDNPNLPCSPAEIAQEVKNCRDAGASIVHIHARDKDQNPTHCGETYAEIFSMAREMCPDIIISGTTSGRIHPDLKRRSEVFCADCHVLPEMASLTLGSMNFPDQASINQPNVIQGLAMRMNELGVVPEWEIFDFGMIDYAKFLIRKDILKKPFYCNIMLGSLGTAAANPHNLAMAVRALPQGCTWSAAGIGRFQFQINCMAIAMGGHVRVGLEDNIWYDDRRTKLATNAALIERIVKIANSMGREIATPDQAREIIGIPERKQKNLPNIKILEITQKEKHSPPTLCTNLRV